MHRQPQGQSTADLINRAIALQRAGHLQPAEQIYLEVLKRNKRHFDALHLLGVIRRQQGRNVEALDLILSALKRNPQAVDALSTCGLVLYALGRQAEAIKYYDRALLFKGGDAEVLNSRGAALRELNRHEEALASYDKALAFKPDYPEALNNRGNALKELKRYEEALASYERALALRPAYANAMIGRGLALHELKRYAEALASYDKALTVKPNYALALYSRGTALHEMKRWAEAFDSYDAAIALEPNLAGAWLGRGNVFYELKRNDEALGAYDKALALEPELAKAWLGRGNVFSQLRRYEEAFDAYDKAVKLEPDLTGAEGSRLQVKMHLCDWSNLDAECNHLIESIRNGKSNAQPFHLLAIPSSPEEQKEYAERWIANEYPGDPVWRGERYEHDRIRVAYLSPDFRQHAVSFLLAGMFECHDKSRFDVSAISVGPDDNSEMRQRLEPSFARFIDAMTYDEDQIANLIKELEIDILVDLAGFTADARTSIFARRPAPIQAIYLGYAGTMGARYFDYILADRIVIPMAKRECYSEKVVYLPNSFMGNDSKRKISERLPRRSECGLPESGFVFCSFNQAYKIIPQQFDIWMRLLRQLDDSVLWLSIMNETAIHNLKREAQNRGVDPGRIVMAQQVPVNEDHLARQQLADLFLDTLPYNAHSTASDALWAGLPVLTCVGETFAGRVAASLLHAIQLPEMITTTPEAYEGLAIELAKHPEKLARIKRKLADNRLTTPLFDTKRFTQHIEAAYATMHERYQAGLASDHIVIPD